MATVDLKEYVQRLDRFKRTEFKRAVVDGLLVAAQRGLQKIVVEIIPSRSPPPVDRGLYRGGWSVDPLPEQGAIIYNDELHAAVIEHGARADNVKVGRSMIQALAEWVTRKGIAGAGKEAVRAAWAIARSMQRRGIFNREGKEGLGILEELVAQHLPDLVQEECEASIRRAAERTLGGT